jgi:hypothetical protein
MGVLLRALIGVVNFGKVCEESVKGSGEDWELPSIQSLTPGDFVAAISRLSDMLLFDCEQRAVTSIFVSEDAVGGFQLSTALGCAVGLNDVRLPVFPSSYLPKAPMLLNARLSRRCVESKRERAGCWAKVVVGKERR